MGPNTWSPLGGRNFGKWRNFALFAEQKATSTTAAANPVRKFAVTLEYKSVR